MTVGEKIRVIRTFRGMTQKSWDCLSDLMKRGGQPYRAI